MMYDEIGSSTSTNTIETSNIVALDESGVQESGNLFYYRFANC
jgi:hypothetical protein